MSKTGYRLILNLSGPEGNAFAVMANVSTVLLKFDRELGTNYESSYTENVLKGNYENVLKISCKYVDLVDLSGEYTHLLSKFY